MVPNTFFVARRKGCVYITGNTPFQSRAAYGAKEALWNMAKEMYLDRSSDLYGSRNVNFVHDENLVEVPEEHAHPAAMRIKKIMEESMMVWTPDVPQKVDPVLMRWWDKKAKPIVDEEGNLLPWGDDQEAA
jgi:DNA polymerase I-like protein with 3'-5' exonuclease and polymerase domains